MASFLTVPSAQVVDADGFMNITMEDAEMLDPAGNTANFKSFHVQGRLIR